MTPGPMPAAVRSCCASSYSPAMPKKGVTTVPYDRSSLKLLPTRASKGWIRRFAWVKYALSV